MISASEGRVAQERGNLICHCSKWKSQREDLWKAVGRETGCKAGRCKHVQISELFSLEKCD